MSADRALAAKRFFAAAIDDYGITEGDRVRIPMRQCDLARQRNVSASTIGAYLTAMGDAVVARHPEIIIAHVEAPSPTQRSTAAAPPAPPSERVDVLELLAELLDVQARLIRAIASGSAPPALHDDGGIQRESVGSAREPRELRETARDPRGFRADPSEGRKEEGLPSFLATANRAGRAETTRGSARYDELLQPLHRLCRDLHLTPLNNRTILEEALAPYGDDQIADAVHDIARQARSGTSNVVSPFGILVSRARSGALTPEASSPSPAQAPDTTGQPDIHDDGILDEVIALETDNAGGHLLESLDDEISAEVPNFGQRSIPLPMRRALRADTLRRRRARPAGAK